MLNSEQSKGAKQSEVKQMEVKQRHPAFTVSNDAMVTPGRTVKPQEVIISPAVKQINREGYAIYNTPEKQDIYITIQPESAFFDDEEPRMVRMAGGSFVGAEKHGGSADIPMKSEQESEHAVYAQPADIFSNACRREKLEEIDFNEVIIKKNEFFETEIEESPVLFSPGYKEIYEPVAEVSFKVVANEAAVTSSAEAVAEVRPIAFAGYREVPEYELEEVHVEPKAKEPEAAPVEVKAEEPMVLFSGYREVPLPEVQEAPVEKTLITEVPAGLYVDAQKPIDIAQADDEMSGLSSFVGMVSTETEIAVTSETAPVAEVIPLQSMDILCLPAPEEAEPAEETVCETAAEKSSETVTDVSAQIEVFDEVADIMRITIPSLRMSDGLINELSQGWEKTIPDDGLEVFDCIFRPVRAPVKEENVSCMASSGSVVRRPSAKPDPYGIFRVD
ncbi:MAG: hypothetical protein FWC29_02275 [Methanomassiliicoccaceae archaeon]|nr:hypothetical protein [Methanomassiliicoccaceae archaeon]